MKNETWAPPGPNDPHNLVKLREEHRIQRSALPEAEALRKAELHAMYALQPPALRHELQAVRARRAIDCIDIFHATMRHEWSEMSDRERVLMLKISQLTARMQRRLQGLANSPV